MEIIIHFDNTSGRFVDATDRGKAMKNRLGTRSAQLSQTMRIVGLRNRIDLRWKLYLTKVMKTNRQFRKEANAIITVIHPDVPAPSLFDQEHGVDLRLTSYSCRNIESFVNHVANYVISVKRSIKYAPVIGEVDLAEVVAVAGPRRARTRTYKTPKAIKSKK